MNLTEKNLSATKEILSILSDIDKENFAIAEKFFDFSKEMDLSLLEKIKFQTFQFYNHSNISIDWVNKHQEPHNEYLTRYILFLDGLGKNTAYFMLGFNTNSSSEMKENLTHAFSLKYSFEDIQAKIAALMATETNDYTVNLSHELFDMAKAQPLVCLKAAKAFCYEKCADAKMLLYVMALHYLEPITEVTDDNRALVEEMSKIIQDLHQYIFMQKNLCSIKALDTVIIYCFMVYHHDISFKKEILNQTSSMLYQFLCKVLNFISPDYLKKSMDDLFDILNFQENGDYFSSGCLKLVLEEMSEKEKNTKPPHEINSDDKGNLEMDSHTLLLIEILRRSGKNQKISWLYDNHLNDCVHLNNGNLAGTNYMQALLICYANFDTLKQSEPAKRLAERLNQEDLNRFAGDVFSAWLDDGASTKKKWVLYFCAIHGGHYIVEGILHYIKEWAESSRGVIAAEAVKALALNGSSEALTGIDNLAHHCKSKSVKNAAVQALERAADVLDITSGELGDRLVPNLGFDENRECIFDYGTRQFKVYLSPTLELEIYDENNKKLKRLPTPAKKDIAEIAKKSNDDFKLLKKQLKNTIIMQKLHLETALIADRRWSVEAWTNLFVKNPIMHSFAIGLVWAVYENDRLTQTFRYMEDGSFNTADENEYKIPENCTIGLVHPIDLSEDELKAWKEQLSDYEIVQPIKQLERPIYRVHEDEIGKFEVLRYKDKTIKAVTLLSHLTKWGWYKNSVQESGFFYSFYREDITKRVREKDTVTLFGNAVELTSSGMYVSVYGNNDNDDVEIESIRFYRPGSVERGSYVYDEPDDARSFKLETVNPRYFSEILAQIESLVKKTDEE